MSIDIYYKDFLSSATIGADGYCRSMCPPVRPAVRHSL